MKIGIVVAMDKELQQLRQVFEGSSVIVEKCGIGKVNADFQISRFKINAQPYYCLLDTDGNILLTWKSGKDKTSFDSKRFAEENPDLYEKYCKTVPGARSFLLKKPKA